MRISLKPQGARFGVYWTVRAEADGSGEGGNLPDEAGPMRRAVVKTQSCNELMLFRSSTLFQGDPLNYTRLLSDCTCCPRQCRVDRLAGERGFCGIGSGIEVAHIGLHFGEEPLARRFTRHLVWSPFCRPPLNGRRRRSASRPGIMRPGSGWGTRPADTRRARARGERCWRRPECAAGR